MASLVVVVGGAACVGTSGLSGGDAGSDAGDSAVDAAADADAAPSDAADAMDPDAAPIFCDGFEHADVLGNWDFFAQSDAGSMLSIDGTEAANGSRSLRLELVASDAGATTEALRRTFIVPGARFVRMRAALKLVVLPPREVHTIAVQYGGTVVTYLNFGQGAVRLAEQRVPNSAYFDAVFGGLTLGTWHSIDVAIDGTRTPSHATVLVDDAQRLDRDLVNDFSNAASLQLSVGAVFAGPGGSYRMWFDDVCLYAHP